MIYIWHIYYQILFFALTTIVLTSVYILGYCLLPSESLLLSNFHNGSFFLISFSISLNGQWDMFRCPVYCFPITSFLSPKCRIRLILYWGETSKNEADSSFRRLRLSSTLVTKSTFPYFWISCLQNWVNILNRKYLLFTNEIINDGIGFRVGWTQANLWICSCF